VKAEFTGSIHTLAKTETEIHLCLILLLCARWHMSYSRCELQCKTDPICCQATYWYCLEGTSGFSFFCTFVVILL